MDRELEYSWIDHRTGRIIVSPVHWEEIRTDQGTARVTCRPPSIIEPEQSAAPEHPPAHPAVVSPCWPDDDDDDDEQPAKGVEELKQSDAPEHPPAHPAVVSPCWPDDDDDDDDEQPAKGVEELKQSDAPEHPPAFKAWLQDQLAGRSFREKLKRFQQKPNKEDYTPSIGAAYVYLSAAQAGISLTQLEDEILELHKRFNTQDMDRSNFNRFLKAIGLKDHQGKQRGRPRKKIGGRGGAQMVITTGRNGHEMVTVNDH